MWLVLVVIVAMLCKQVYIVLWKLLLQRFCKPQYESIMALCMWIYFRPLGPPQHI